MNLAIIIGVENYQDENYTNLPACKNDAKTINDVLNNIKEIEETLLIYKNEVAYQVKNKISSFIEKHKTKDIDELIFYFSGHGERYAEDFFYLLSDFTQTKRETTGLRNSELDDWLKTLSPKLCVKIVDACFSGTQYIKSESNIEHNLKKTAQKYGLNDIYFWFSSRENEESIAGAMFSKFTESLLVGVTKHTGNVRYRDIMAYIADDFSNKEISKPIFVTQSDNIEKLGNITESTHELINNALGVNLNNSSNKITETQDKKNITLWEKVRTKSKNICFDETFLLNFIKTFNKNISLWDEDIKSIYDIKCQDDLECKLVPNSLKIGIWLKENQSFDYFAEPTYENEKYKTEEYKILPRKPMNKSLNSLRSLSLFGEKDIEYKLETVTKERKYINGFNYTHNIENRIIHLSFIPKIELVSPLSLYIIPIYSNTTIIFHIAYEVLKRNNWTSYTYPQCLDWKLIKLNNINNEKSSLNAVNHIKTEMKKWISEILTKEI